MFDLDKIFHLYPLDDTKKHVLEFDYFDIGLPYCPCLCKPKFEEENHAMFVVHNYFDGREVPEYRKDVMSKKKNPIKICSKSGFECAFNCIGNCFLYPE